MFWARVDGDPRPDPTRPESEKIEISAFGYFRQLPTFSFSLPKWSWTLEIFIMYNPTLFALQSRYRMSWSKYFVRWE